MYLLFIDIYDMNLFPHRANIKYHKNKNQNLKKKIFKEKGKSRLRLGTFSAKFATGRRGRGGEVSESTRVRVTIVINLNYIILYYFIP